MKNILFAAFSLDYGGIETALVTLLKYLATEYNITLVLEKKQGVFINDLPKSVKVITYTPSANKIVFVRKIANFFKQIKFRLKYKNKFDFSVSYATYSLPCSFVARQASKNSCIWIHNDYLNFYNNDLIQYKKFFKDLKIEKFKKIVFVSNFDRKIFNAEFPYLIGKTFTCNNLIDYEKIISKSQEKVDDFKKSDLVTFINIGRHDEKQKKLSRIINATRRLNKEGYKFRVIFIGKGSASKQYINEAKNIKNIEFLGAKKNPYPYLKNSDCFILSSKFEGYPVVLVESMILNKPIVTTDVSDVKKDIDGKYGIVVENSERGVYEGMKKFLDNGFTPEEFSPEDFNKKIIKTIKQIINKTC